MLSLTVAILVGILGAVGLTRLVKNYLPATVLENKRAVTTISIVVGILVGLLISFVEVSVNGLGVAGKLFYYLIVPVGVAVFSTLAYDTVFSLIDSIKEKLKK